MTEIANFLVGDVGLGTILFWAMAAALLIAGGKWGRGLALASLVLAMPVASQLASLPLDASTHGSSEIDEVSQADAVAVFGGGVFADDLGGMWPSRESIRRATVGRELAQRLARPLVISGGRANPALAAEAPVIGRILGLDEMAVIEDKARNTEENAHYISLLARQNGWRSVIVVTSRSHTRRAASAMRSTDVRVAAVVGVGPRPVFAMPMFLPSAKGLVRWSSVLHEYAGIVWYLSTGGIRPGELAAAGRKQLSTV